ncbi:MAG: kelch repeat-containing protein [Xanthobacteraceae bacterium]
MSRRLNCCRRASAGLAIAFASALVVPVMASAASAQDKGSWTAVSTMPSGTGDSAVASLDGKIYIFGGSTFRPHILPDSSDMGSGTWGSTVNYEYEPKTDTWRERAPLPIGLSHISAVSLNGKLYTFGGFTNLVHKNPQTVALAYDPAVDKWQQLAPMSTALGSVSVAVVDGKIHAFGGRPGDPTPTNFHEAYDPATNQWSKKAPMPKARDHMGVAVIDGKIHIVGGRTGGQIDNIPDHDVYDPATDQWTKAAPMPTPRSGVAAVYYHGLLLVLGGECRRPEPHAKAGGGEAFDENEAYDPKTDSWLTLAKLPGGRQAIGAATDGEAAYVPGGTLRCGGLSLTDQMLAFRLK